MKNKLSILVIEDDEDDYFLLSHLIQKNPYLSVELLWIKTVDEAMSLFTSHTFDLILIDYYLGKNTAIDFLKFSENIDFFPPVIVLTGMNNREKDIEVMKAGAADYIPKEKLSETMIERVIRYNIDREEQNKWIKSESIKYKQLFELSLDALFLTDDTFTFIQVNDSFKSLFKLDANQEKIYNLKTIISSSEDHTYILEKLHNNQEVKNYPITIKVSKNNSLDVLFSISKFTNFLTNKIEYQGTIHDVTKLNRAKEKAKNQEQINTSGKMARTVAHEIRNPLTNIGISITEIEETTTNEEHQLFIDIIKRSNKKIDEIVTEFINSTKPTELNPTLSSVHDAIEIAKNDCMDRLQLKNIFLELQLEATNLISADNNKLALVFINLITNAIEALENSNTPKITIQTENYEKGVCVRVEDNGIGMDEETKNNLFNSFFTKKSSGLGIGMSTIYNILTAHNAYIEVESTLGKGSSFIIYFD